MIQATWKPFAELTPMELYQILWLRVDVFMLEQNCLYQEVDGNGTYTIGAPPLGPELGIYSESHAQSSLPLNITNGADFGGNVLSINTNSTNVAPFDGSVREGAPHYPGNVNISAAAAFAGAGLDKTRLVIIADPTIQNHLIELEAFGAAGRLAFTEDMRPHPDNPKTGVIVAMALAKTIRQRASSFVVGA